MDLSWLSLVRPAPLYEDLMGMHDPYMWEPLLPCIGAAMEAGEDLVGLRDPQMERFPHRPTGGTILDVMVLNANLYFRSHPFNEWPEYLSIVEQLALQGVPMVHELDLNLSLGVECLHAALAAGRVEDLKAFKRDEEELDFSVFDEIIYRFGYFCSKNRATALNHCLLTPRERHYIEVVSLLQKEGLTAKMNADAVLTVATWYNSYPGNFVIIHVDGHVAGEVAGILWPRLVLILLSGLGPQLEFVIDSEGRSLLLYEVVKVLIVSGQLVDDKKLELLQTHGVTSRTCRLAMIDARRELLKFNADLRTEFQFSDAELRTKFPQATLLERKRRNDSALSSLYEWFQKDTVLSGLVQRTLEARVPGPNISSIIDTFLFGPFAQAIRCVPHVSSNNAEMHDLQTTSSNPRQYEEVIDEEIEHGTRDVPAMIMPEEAALVTSELWAGSVEQINEHGAQLHGFVLGQPLPTQSPILMLTFSRNPKELEDAIVASGPAQAAIDSGVEIKPAWANGAKILIEDVDPERLSPQLNLEELRPWHVLLWERDEERLFDALSDLPYNVKKLRPGGKLLLFSASSSSEGLSSTPSLTSEEAQAVPQQDITMGVDVGVQDIQVQWTFIHFKSPKSDSRSANTV